MAGIESFPNDDLLSSDAQYFDYSSAANPIQLQIPTQAGHLFRFDRGHPSDLKPATIPI